MKIYFKLKAFPKVSETFVVSNIRYAKTAGYEIKIYVNKFLGFNSSSQKRELQNFNLDKAVIKPLKLKGSKIKRFVEIACMLFHPKVAWFSLKYYKFLKAKGDSYNQPFNPIIELYQYRSINKSLVHVHFNNALQPLLNLAAIGYVENLKCIVTFHGHDAFKENKEGFNKKYGHFYKKHVVAVTVNSNYLKQQVIKLGVDIDKINIIPIGVDTSFFKASPKKLDVQTIKLVSVGRLVQLKGQIYAIRALKELLEMGHKATYTLIGEGSNKALLTEEVNRLNLSSSVFFEGSKSQLEVKSLLEKSDIYLMTSTFDDRTLRREAFGLVSIEAQAMGMPVIGFDSGGFIDTIKDGETGFLVEDRNSDQIVEKICYLINNPELYEKMSQAAIAHSKTYDLKYTTQQYLDLYKEFSD